MNQRKHLTLVAAAAALLATMPISPVFESWTWLLDAALMVAALCGTAVLVRSLRAPVWAPTLAMVGAALIVLTWLFPSREEILGIVPSTATFAHFADLLNTAGTEMSQFAAPVENRDGFLFLTTLGVAGVAIVIDLFAVVLRRPALTGLPMLAIYSVPVAVSDESVNLIPFALGAAGFLWLLVTDNVDRVRRFGRRFTGDGRDVDLWEPSPLAAAGQRLGAVGIALAVLLPLAIPGMTTGLLAQFGSNTGAGGLRGGNGSGSSVGFIALLSGELRQQRSVEMLRITNVNDPSPFYLRFGVADDLTAQGFRTRPLSGGQPAANDIQPPSYHPSVQQRQHRASAEILNLQVPYLPVYTYPTKLDRIDNNWQFDRTTATVYTGRQQTRKGLRYSFDYARPEFPVEDLRRAPSLADNDPLRQYTRHPQVAEVRDRVRDLTEGKTTQYDRVRAIFDSFSTSQGFIYDLTTGEGTSGSQIVDFLTNKRGFCVQFAAAMAWMVREAGYPARVAFGFTGGGNKQGNTTTLTNFNLHAWTEVYFSGFGWVPFDATPSTSVAGSVSPPWAPNPSAPITSDPNDPTDAIPDRGAGVDPSASANPNDPSTGLGGDETITNGPAETESPVRMIVVSVSGLAVLLLLAVPALTRLTRRRRRLTFATMSTVAVGSAAAGRAPEAPGGQPGEVVVAMGESAEVAARADAHQAWDELIDTMIDYGVPVDEAETPRATGARLVAEQHLRDQAETGAKLLSTAEERARYARRPITGTELRSALGSIRTALAGRAERSTRIRAVLLPPSVLQRWRYSISRSSADLVNAMGRRRDRLVRVLSVRRLITRKATR